MVSAFLVTAAVTFLTAPAVLWILRHRSVYDIPNDRSGHDRPIPRGGGIAQLVGIVAGAFTAHELHYGVPWLALLIVFGVAIIGWLDDIDIVPGLHGRWWVLVRLACQVLAGGLLGWWLGRPILIIVGIVALAWIVNVTNFMDGINGISGFTCVLWGGVSWWCGEDYGMPIVSLLGVLSIAIGLGFLPWNAVNAKMFPGDVGAYLYGAIYTLGVLLAANKGWHAAVITLAPLSVYLADTSYTLAKRMLAGHHPFEPHREFVFHRLVKVGRWPHWVVAMLVVGLSAIITIPWIVLDGIAISITVTFIVCGIYLLLPELLLLLRRRKRSKR